MSYISSVRLGKVLDYYHNTVIQRRQLSCGYAMGIMASNCKNSLHVCDFAALVATACGIERHDGSHGRACLDFGVVFLHFGCMNLWTCI